MRLVGVSVTALLLGGCSFLNGGFGGAGDGHGPRYGAQYGAHHAAKTGAFDPCQIPYAQAPIPQGCHPSQVSIGLGPQGGHGAGQGGAYAGGFPQEPQFGHAQYATGGYGSHAGGNVHTAGLRGATPKGPRRPRFRGALDLGLEQSIQGDLIDYSRFDFAPNNGYIPNDFAAAVVDRVTDADGNETTNITAWTAGPRRPRPTVEGGTEPALFDEVSRPNISISDAWSAPTSIGASGEFILGPKATVFGRVGYTRAQGNSGDAVSVEGTVFQSNYVDVNPDTFVFDQTDGRASRQFETEQQLATFSYDFSDMERVDLEAGGRLFFDPIGGQRTGQTVTPFVGASAGASRYNAVSYTIDQRQLAYDSLFQANEAFYYDVDALGFDLDGDPATPLTDRVELYDSQWVPAGRLAAGVEWQVTPRTALAFETGLRVEGARDYANGEKGDTNVSVPVTLRGSFNF